MSRPAAPAWDGARNLADLGGLALASGGTTAAGRVFRSAAPEWMTDRGWNDARAAGLTTVVDLRNERERGRTDEHPVLAEDAKRSVAVVHAPTEDPEDSEFLAVCGPWLDHPRSWADNMRFYPEKIARVLTAISDARGAVLVHCAGGRDRTGMIGSILLVLAGATPDAIVANYEAGFRGAAEHRGHGWSYDVGRREWVAPDEQRWTAEELDAALADRRPALVAWLRTFDVPAYLLDAGMDLRTRARLEQLLAE